MSRVAVPPALDVGQCEELKSGGAGSAVRSVNAHGASGWTDVQSIAPPCAVEGLRATYAANGDVSVSWNPAKRADSYDVNFSADNGRSWQRMETGLAATSTTFTKDPAALPYNPNFLVAV